MNYLHLTRPLNPAVRVLTMIALIFLILSLILFLLIGPRKFLRSANDLINAPTTKLVPQLSLAVLDPNAISTEHRATEITHLLHRRWEDSLLAVEKVNIKDVTILEFHPDYSNGALVLHGEAKEFDALSEYIKQLNATGLVSHVELMHEQGVSREHVDTVEFELRGDL
jgi:hypothetical protein